MYYKKASGYAACCILSVLFVWMLGPMALWAETRPLLNNGKKWRIGYYEGGAFSDYTDTMRILVNGLIELGWIKDKDPPKLYGETIKPYWEWLHQCNSPFLSFRREDSYSADWDEQKRRHIRKTLLKKLKAGDLDLVIAMGTWAGQDLANKEHAVPTMVLSTSDPVKAGIIKSPEKSGFDHVTARVDPQRYIRQIRMFHRIVGFQSIGIAYENTPDGRIYSAIGDVRQVAGERGFKVILCEVLDTTDDIQKSDQSCLECYRKLSEKAEAVYVTALICVDRNPEAFASVLRESKTPSFSMMGSKYVEKGIMLSISNDSGYIQLGKYNAMKLAEILNGSKPGALKQVFEDPLEISVNMETVRQVGFNMPGSILKISREVYER